MIRCGAARLSRSTRHMRVDGVPRQTVMCQMQLVPPPVNGPERLERGVLDVEVIDVTFRQPPGDRALPHAGWGLGRVDRVAGAVRVVERPAEFGRVTGGIRGRLRVEVGGEGGEP